MSRPQKPSLRDFYQLQAQNRNQLCMDIEIFSPCEKLRQLTAFEQATLKSWSSDSNVDSGLNLYILVHFLSAINENSYYYHYINNGNPDGTNMFGHIIGTSGSGKSSALTPHMDALGRTLAQMDINQQYIQSPCESNGLSFTQPFIISNATALHVYRSLMYGNRILCSTECDTLLSNLGVYGNQYNDPRFAENVNMLIQMFDGTKHQNRSTLSTSYVIPEGRRATIIGASVGDPYARVSQQHYEGNGISGAHNRFTHYPCPVMKPVKVNSGSTGIISNMVPSLQHVYTVSMLLGKVEYVPRQNLYDKSERRQTNKLNSEVEEKWRRLRPMDNREYTYSSSRIEIELEEPEVDATPENSKSAFYYMFNRVYNQWEEATASEKQEHEAIINFKNSTKIPRFICNFARFRSIMNILWDDAVYQHLEIGDVVNSPYHVSNAFIEAVKNVIDKQFPSSLRKDDGTKILVIEKDTAIMGDLFFGHVDQVSRRLFDLLSIQDKLDPSSTMFRSLKRNFNIQETGENDKLIHLDASMIMKSKFIFFSGSTFTHYRQFHNNKNRLTIAMNYLIGNQLIYQSSGKRRFIKGTHISYTLATPSQIKNNTLCMETFAKLNLNMNDYEHLWQQCILPSSEMATKIEKSAIEHVRSHLNDYISIIHRLGAASDPVAQEIIKPGLKNGRIGIDFESNIFSLKPEHTLYVNTNDYIQDQLNKLCVRATNQVDDVLNFTSPSADDNDYSTANMPCMFNAPMQCVGDHNQLQTEQISAIHSNDISSDEYDQVNTSKQQYELKKKVDVTSMQLATDINIINDCLFVMEKIKIILENNSVDTVHSSNDVIYVQKLPYNEEGNRESSTTINNLAEIPFDTTLSCENSTTSGTYIKTTDRDSSIEYDYPTTDSLHMHKIDDNLCNQQQPYKESLSELSSRSTIDNDSNEEYQNFDSYSMEIDFDSDLLVPSSNEIMQPKHKRSSINSETSSNEENIQPTKKFDIVALSKRLMIKPFLTFTQTDVTRLYNSADTKNVIIGYLQEHGFIRQIDDLFLSSIPTKKKMKPEIGYLKLFPVSQSAYDTASFETKLRDKIGLSLDEYIAKIFNNVELSPSTVVMNNMFNTARHNWLLNRLWYNKINEGQISIYFKNNAICPDNKMSVTMVTVSTVSDDNVHDSFDCSRPKLTSSQRTTKELKRLGAKRQRESDDEPLPKRQRKPKRFMDED